MGGMIVVHTMPRIGWGLLSPSPFCAKVELYLKMLGEPYEVRPTLSAAAGPHKKLPWIEDNGSAITDSEVILDHLRTLRGDPLGEEQIPADERARHHLARRTAEESLYFVIVAERWRDETMYAAYTADLLGSVPALARPVVAALARRMLLKQLWQQGTGRHSLEAALSRGTRDIDALAWALGQAPYFAGAQPAGIDAALWGSLANIWFVPVGGTLKRAVGAHPALVAWLERVAERYQLGELGGA